MTIRKHDSRVVRHLLEGGEWLCIIHRGLWVEPFVALHLAVRDAQDAIWAIAPFTWVVRFTYWLSARMPHGV